MNYKDRLGHVIENKTSQDALLEKVYNSYIGRAVLKLITKPWLSKIGGKVLQSRLSTKFIDSFIKANDIDMEQYQLDYYRSYNEFFTRKIKADYRPIAMEKEKLISPCDGKLSVYPIDDQTLFKIKNSNYTVKSLLRNKKLAERFRDGYCLLFRLTVDDYHRYCYVDNGIKSKNYQIKGRLHTVNPIATEHYPIYKENAREYTMIKSENFGNIVQMEVGALFVGKIKNYHEAEVIAKGQEKGYFEFGGSTIILFLEKDQVNLREDLLKNTIDGFETIVKMGEDIGDKR